MGSFRLAINDLPNTNNIMVDTEFVEYQIHTYVDYFWRNRTVTITYSRPFGNKRLKAVKRESALEEDINRVKVE